MSETVVLCAVLVGLAVWATVVFLYVNSSWPFCDHHWCQTIEKVLRHNPCGKADTQSMRKCCRCKKEKSEYHFQWL